MHPWSQIPQLFIEQGDIRRTPELYRRIFKQAIFSVYHRSEIPCNPRGVGYHSLAHFFGTPFL